MNIQKMKNWEEKKIVVYRGDENRASIRKEIENSSDFFNESYKAALEVVRKICEASSKYYEENKKSMKDSKFQGCDEIDTKLLGYTNNFVLFSAQRGAGKTSAMVTFANALKMGKHLDGKRFIILSEIDPTAMEAKDSILKMIISRMFVNVRCKWNEYKKQGDADCYEIRKDKLIKLFQECYRDIDTLKQNLKQDDIYDDLLKLSELGDSTHLKSRMFALIKDYLKFMSEDEKAENNFLIIQIDDVDLNTRKVYEILEDLRKYLILPNVIILMASDVNQLRFALERNYTEEYEILLRYNKSMYGNNCHDMAERYIEKVFPVIHQIHLPEIDDAIMEESRIIHLEYTDSKGENNTLLYTDSQGELLEEYRDILLRLIYSKTGLLLISPRNLHELLPRKMRELTHFLEYMDAMPESEVEDLIISARKHYDNLIRFEEYLDQYWSPYYLDVIQLRYYDDFKERFLEKKQELCSYELWNLLLGEKAGNNSESKDVETVETRLNQILIREENLPNRKLIELMLTFLSIQENKKALLNFGRKKCLIGVERLFMDEKIEIKIDSELHVSSKFPILYKDFKKIMSHWHEEEMKGAFVEQNINMFIKGKNKKYFDVFGLFSYYSMKEFDIDYAQDEEKNAYFSVFDIMTNNDLKREVYRALTEETMEDKEGELVNPTEIILKIYEKIDRIINSCRYSGRKSQIAYFLNREKSKNNPVITTAFLCNESFVKYYFEKFKKLIINNIPIIEMTSKTDMSQNQKVINDIMYMDVKRLNTPSDLGIDDLMLQESNIRRLFELNESLKKPLTGLQDAITQYMNREEDKDLLNRETQEWIAQYKDIVQKWNQEVGELTFQEKAIK